MRTIMFLLLSIAIGFSGSLPGLETKCPPKAPWTERVHEMIGGRRSVSTQSQNPDALPNTYPKDKDSEY